jgi:hypothetical protein
MTNARSIAVVLPDTGSRFHRNKSMKDTQMAKWNIPGRKLVLGLSVLMVAGALGACSPEVGSKEWCEDMKAKPKGDWTANEATDFAKHCVF